MIEYQIIFRRMLDDEEPLPMQPWYKNFKGTVQLLQDKFIVSGEASILPNDTIEITELPIGTWALPYKSNVLHRMLGNDGVKATISKFEVIIFILLYVFNNHFHY